MVGGGGGGGGEGLNIGEVRTVYEDHPTATDLLFCGQVVLVQRYNVLFIYRKIKVLFSDFLL